MKRHQILSLGLVIFFLCGGAQPVFAQTHPPVSSCGGNVTYHAPDQVRIIGSEASSSEVQALFKSFNDLLLASNKHSLEDILKHYSPQFISGDNLTLDQVKNLIVETWKSYPDICYDSKPIEVRVHGDWATIETMDRSVATAPADKDILDTPGRLNSESRSLLFFRKIGNSWEITSDSTIWEQAIIRYGVGDDLKVILSAPEQVKAGEDYSVTVQASIPEGTFSIVTIDNQPLTYPHEKVDDKFRTLNPDSSQLQRVLKANTNNRNEIVTATIGLTNLTQKDMERPSLALNGIATVVKRVNVVPISAEDALDQLKRKNMVRTSADGKVNLSDQADLLDEEADMQSYELELVPSDDSPDAEEDVSPTGN